MPITHALSPSPWRLVVLFNGAAPSPSASQVEVRRGGVTRYEVSAVWKPTGRNDALEIALRDPVVADEVFTVAIPALGVAAFSFALRDAPTMLPERGDLFAADDPEGEAYGIDVDWLAASLDPTGDVPEVRGIACLRHDLAVVALMQPGDLVHLPTEGVGLRSMVNGPGTPQRLAEAQAAVRAAYLADDRVASAEVAVSTTGGNQTVVRANVKAAPLEGDEVNVEVRL